MNKEEMEKKIEEQNKEIIHTVWIILISLITSIITVLAAKG